MEYNDISLLAVSGLSPIAVPVGVQRVVWWSVGTPPPFKIGTRTLLATLNKGICCSGFRTVFSNQIG